MLAGPLAAPDRVQQETDGLAADRGHVLDAHQSADPDAWVILMDQPFAGMVKELFEPQSYPNLAQRPYDVTGWTLPYQMGVEAHALTTPLTKQFRDSLHGFRSMAAHLLQVGHTLLLCGDVASAVEDRFFVDRFVMHGRVSQGRRDGALPFSAQSARGSTNELPKRFSRSQRDEALSPASES